MTQEEFNRKYSGEEIDALLDKVAAMEPTTGGGTTQ